MAYAIAHKAIGSKSKYNFNGKLILNQNRPIRHVFIHRLHPSVTMAGNPHSRPYIVDEAGNPVFEIPRSTNTIFYRYETRIVDRMPVSRRPRSKSALEKLKEVINVPDGLLRIPGNILGAPKARPVSWGGAPRGEGRYYYVDGYGRTIETSVTRTSNPPAPPAPSGYPVQNQAQHAHGGSLTGAVKAAKDKDVLADAAERMNNAALFARIGSGGVPGSSGGSGSAAGATGGGSGVSGGGGSGGGSSGMGGILDGSSLFDW